MEIPTCETQEQCFFSEAQNMFFAVLFRAAHLPRTFVFTLFFSVFFDGKKHTVFAILFLSLTVFPMLVEIAVTSRRAGYDVRK